MRRKTGGCWDGESCTPKSSPETKRRVSSKRFYYMGQKGPENKYLPLKLNWPPQRWEFYFLPPMRGG